MTKELVFSHFMGKTSAMQKQSIDEWVSIGDNEERYYKWLDEYENLHPEYAANLDRAIVDYRHFLEQQNQPKSSGKKAEPTPEGAKRRLGWVLRMGAAAAISLILLLFGVRNTELWKYKALRTGYGQTQAFLLPDGSRVTLNANSSLKVPRWDFGKTNRQVFLEGEASFSVKHIAGNIKFVVQTAKQFDIEVLGTEFSVFARKRGAKVVLSKGKVQINLHEDGGTRKMVMKPGDLVTFDANGHVETRKILKPEALSAWRSHRYVFDQTTLQEIMYLLEDNYGLAVEVEDKKLLSLTVSGTLTVENADHIFELIETVLDLQITKGDHKIFISQNNP